MRHWLFWPINGTLVICLLGIPRRECLMVLSEYFYFIYIYFLFFRRQGLRMITFDRQAGPLQNFNRSHVMVIGRSVSFSDAARPPGGGVGRPNPPPPKKQFSRGKKTFFLRFKTPGRCFCGKKMQLLKTSTGSDQYTYMSCVHVCVCHDNIVSVMISCKQI